MFKKFVLSLVFVGSIGTQSDAMQKDLLDAPLEMKNFYDIEYIERADEIVNKMDGFDCSDSVKIKAFMENTFEKYASLDIKTQNAFKIYTFFVGDSEVGELGVDDSVIFKAREIWKKLEQ